MTATATAGTRRRRLGGWLILAVVLIGAAVAAGALGGIGQWSQRDLFDPESASPQGTRALAHTLAAHGVSVRVTRDDTPPQAVPGTLVVGDTAPLSDEQVAALADGGQDVVLLQPSSRDVRVLFDSRTVGYGTGTSVDPGCGWEAAERAGALKVGTLFATGTADHACYSQGDGDGLLVRERDGGVLAAVDGAELFTNELIADDGNAALALALLGRTGSVTWYVPSHAAGGGPATLGSLTPPWVTPAILLLIGATVAAALWRGRRFGPLVAERLPVTVRGGETTRGRARLYAASGDAAHAGALVREAARHRLTQTLGLPGETPAATVAAIAAARLRPGETEDPRALLTGPAPATDADLVRLTAALDALEAALRRSDQTAPIWDERIRP